MKELPDASSAWKNRIEKAIEGTARTITQKALRVTIPEDISSLLDNEAELLKQLRNSAYLPLINLDEPVGRARDGLVTLGNLLSYDLRHSLHPVQTSSPPDVQIAFWSRRKPTLSSAWHSLQPDQSPFLIGKKPWCDLILPSDAADTSRLHCIVFSVGDSVVFVDIGSISGLGMTRRTSTSPLESSLPNNRKVIVVPAGDIVTFALGRDVCLQLNGPSCIICCNAPRSVLFEPCHHFLLCQACFAELLLRDAKCPTCRGAIGASLEPVAADSYQMF